MAGKAGKSYVNKVGWTGKRLENNVFLTDFGWFLQPFKCGHPASDVYTNTNFFDRESLVFFKDDHKCLVQVLGPLNVRCFLTF